MARVTVSRVRNYYQPEQFTEGDRVRLYITHGYGEIEFRQGIVLDNDRVTHRGVFGKKGLTLKVEKAGRVYDRKISLGGAYCSSTRFADMLRRGVNTKKPFTRTYAYGSNWFAEKLVAGHWREVRQPES